MVLNIEQRHLLVCGGEQIMLRGRLLFLLCSSCVVTACGQVASSTMTSAGSPAPSVPSVATESVADALANCKGAVAKVAAESGQVPPTPRRAVLTTGEDLRAWDEGGRGGLGLPAQVPAAAAPPSGPIDFCWFEGEFTGFPVPAGAVSTFRYVAYMADPSGQVVPLMATNNEESVKQAPPGPSLVP